jgi:uncharacterized protein (DUF58 family)
MAAKSGQLLPADVRERLSKLELNARNVVEGTLSGLHKSPYHGYSIEFAQHREYTWGDEIKHLDWKVFARSDRYYIKQYEEETNLTGLMLLDCSESMLYQSDSHPGGQTKYEYGALVAASLCFLLLRQQDMAGLYLFDDDIREQVPASSHPMTLQNFARKIAGIELREESAIGTLFHKLAEDIRRRGLVFIISDFFFPRADLLQALRHLRHKRQEVILLHVMDPDELQFPFDDNIRFDGYETSDKVFVEPRALREAYLEVMREFIQEIEQCCSDTQSDYLLLDTSKPLKHVLAEYLNTYRNRR